MWYVQIEECERGWGCRVDEIKEFSTYEKALKFSDNYNRKYNSAISVPDWYMMSSKPYTK